MRLLTDLYHVLVLLPRMLEQSSTLPTWPEKDAIQPIDEVVYTIRQMMGIKDELASIENGTTISSLRSKSTGIFDILAPTDYDARAAAINNRQSNQADIERRSGQWGVLRGFRDVDYAIPLSRADMTYNLLRQGLDLPLQASPSCDGELELHKGKRKAAMVWPDQVTTSTLLDRENEVEERRAAYEFSKRDEVSGTKLSELLPSKIDATSAALHDIIDQCAGNRTLNLGDMVASARRSVGEALRSSFDEPQA